MMRSTKELCRKRSDNVFNNTTARNWYIYLILIIYNWELKLIPINI